MPPKDAKKKKGPSKAALENEQQIRALVSAYAAAARASLSRPSADLVKKIEEAAEKGKPLECIALAEPLNAPGTQAICDVLAGRGARTRKRRMRRGGGGTKREREEEGGGGGALRCLVAQQLAFGLSPHPRLPSGSPTERSTSHPATRAHRKPRRDIICRRGFSARVGDTCNECVVFSDKYVRIFSIFLFLASYQKR